MVAYKQRCSSCKEKWALVRSRRQKLVVCDECQMKVVTQKVEDKEYTKMFDIPVAWYKDNPFLLSIRYQYSRFESLTERQVEAFKKTVKELKAEAKKPKKTIKKVTKKSA